MTKYKKKNYIKREIENKDDLDYISGCVIMDYGYDKYDEWHPGYDQYDSEPEGSYLFILRSNEIGDIDLKAFSKDVLNIDQYIEDNNLRKTENIHLHDYIDKYELYDSYYSIISLDLMESFFEKRDESKLPTSSLLYYF